MLDLVPLIIVLAIAAVVTAMAVTILNRRARRPDALQGILERTPLFGKQFVELYYADLPRNVVFEVRSEFARLAGLPADFLLPSDQLTALGAAGSDDVMRGFIAALAGRKGGTAGGGSPEPIPDKLSTLDDCIRAAASAWQAALRGSSAGISETSTPNDTQAHE